MTDLSQPQESDGGDDSNTFPNFYQTSYSIDNYDNDKL